MKSRGFIVALYVSLLGHTVCAQQLCGVVLDERGQGLPGAVIKLYASDSTDRLRAYTIATADGKWCFAQGVSGKWIVVHMLGYEEYRGGISMPSPGEEIVIRLRPRHFSLQEVTVPGKRPAIAVRGDTVEYNVAHYRTQTDHNLGEVLNKMEGFEVTRDGEIKYLSRRVDKLLIEGKDILNDQHKMAVEGIKPIDVKGIQIIHNYRPFHERFIERWSQKIALNIVLTERAKARPKGDAKAAGGMCKRYEGVVNLYEVHDSLGYSSFVRTNNVGEAVLTANDFLNMESDLLRALNKSRGQIDQLVPGELLRGESEQSSTDHLVAYNREIQSGESKDKISLLAHHFIRMGTSAIERWPSGEGNALHLRRERRVRFPFIYGVFNRKEHTGDRRLYEIVVPVRYMASNVSERLKGGTFFTRRGIIIASTMPVLGSGRDSVFQWQNRQKTRCEANASLRYKRSAWGIVLKMPMVFDNIAFELRDDLKGRAGKENFHTKLLEIRPEIGMDYKRSAIRIRSSVALPHTVIYFWDHRYSGQFIQPSVTAWYYFNRLHRIHVHLRSERGFFEPEMLFSTVVIEDGSTLKAWQIPQADQVQRTTTITTGYFNLLPHRGIYLQSHVSYVIREHAIFPVAEVRDQYLLYRVETAKAQKTLRGRVSLQRKFFHNQLTLQLKLSLKEIWTEKDLLYRFRGRNLDLRAQTNFERGINLGVLYGLNQLEQAIGGTHLLRFQTHRIEGSMRYAKGKIKGHTDIAVHLRQGGRLRASFAVWNMGAQYRIRPRWECYVEGRDLLNLHPTEVFNYRFFPSYYEVERYQRFPGSVVMGVRWSL